LWYIETMEALLSPAAMIGNKRAVSPKRTKRSAAPSHPSTERSPKHRRCRSKPREPEGEKPDAKADGEPASTDSLIGAHTQKIDDATWGVDETDDPAAALTQRIDYNEPMWQMPAEDVKQPKPAQKRRSSAVATYGEPAALMQKNIVDEPAAPRQKPGWSLCVEKVASSAVVSHDEPCASQRCAVCHDYLMADDVLRYFGCHAVHEWPCVAELDAKRDAAHDARVAKCAKCGALAWTSAERKRCMKCDA
jgi:hypothetical protein